jgi:hypothetical protein
MSHMLLVSFLVSCGLPLALGPLQGHPLASLTNVSFYIH